MPSYNKLVRDKIPEIIKRKTEQYTVKKLDDETYIQELRRKLQEELKEYLEATSNEEALEELADLVEIIHALSFIHNGNFEKVEAIRQRKLKERGGFTEKIYLIDVDDSV